MSTIKQQGQSRSTCRHCSKDCLTFEKLGDHLRRREVRGDCPSQGKPKQRRLRAVPKEQTSKPEAIYIRLKTAAVLIDSTRGALHKRLIRNEVPPGVMTRFGKRILIHKQKFLKWVAGNL